ncbi:MAG: FAD-binding oxidoreductase [Flavobacteriales bacterium]|nr:FAD-binding oxidoreductase [Flavobacteriales bacterium]
MDEKNNGAIAENWWKWGDPKKSFHLSEYPKLRVFLEEKWEKPITESLKLPGPDELVKPSLFGADEFQSIYKDLDASQFSNNDIDRLKYGFGKGYQDALNILTKKEVLLPDFVLYPQSEKDVRHILQQSEVNDISVTTFSGGTNVTECFRIEKKRKWACALNMKKMKRILEVDPVSLTVTVECGIFGPDLEKQLNEKGFTMGHFPQSFEFSTVGGWLATRSAGQESGKYGKIEDMVLRLKAVTPRSTIENRDYPKHATGIDTFPLFVGSEGTLGVIVEAKMRIHHLPKSHAWVVGLFKDFSSGASALRSMVQSGEHPAICRLSDPAETKVLSLLSNTEPTGVKKLFQNLMKSYLKGKGYTEPSMLMMKFLGSSEETSVAARNSKQILRNNGAVILPGSVSSNWEEKRFSLPYLRETVIQHRILIDMFETSTYWDNLMPLYAHIKKSLEEKSDYFEKGNVLFCHISHIYKTGASLYFTLLASQEEGNELAQWENIKEIVTTAIFEKKAAISHHHGIGRTHRKWYNQQLNPDERSLLKAIKSHLDPKGVLNPGKLFDEA